MFTAEETILIDAAPAEVFAFLDDPTNLVAVAPSLRELEVSTVGPDDRTAGRFTYQLAGVDLGGRFRVAERDPDTLLVRELTGGVEVTLRTVLEAAKQGTVATYRAAFDLPDVVAERLSPSVVETYCRNDVTATLANLKAQVEHDQ